MKKKICRTFALPGLLALSSLNASAFADEPVSFSHTNVQLSREHLTLDLEILPHMLQQANVLRDLDGDGQMSQAELDHAKTAILSYVRERVGITLNQRALKTDSASITYRLQDAAAAPSRIYVTCSYALLLKPEHLCLRNNMLQEFAATHKNYGTITNGKQTVDFELPSETATAEFEISGNGITLINNAPVFFSSTLKWLATGGGGLFALGLIAYLRKLARRRARRAKRAQRTSTSTSASPSSPRRAYELEKVVS